MKIACISTSRIPSDTANSIQVMKTCQALARLGHEVRLSVPAAAPAAAPGTLPGALPGEQPAAWDELAERYGLSTPFAIAWLRASPRLRRNDFAWHAVRAARHQSADMVYTWTGQAAVLGLLRGLPVIFEAHDLPTGRLGPLWLRAFWRLPGRKRLLPITRALRERLEARFGPFTGGDVVIAPNGVDLEQYPPRGAESAQPQAARRALGLPEQVTVLCAGHLYAGRGADLFLALARQFPRASFVWVGGRPGDVLAWRGRAEAAGLNNVTFAGHVSQRALPAYQAAADVLLMPYGRAVAGSSGGNSADVCSPMKMFDYLAAGRAILSSDLPVIHEVLHDGSARFARPDDPADWTAALGALLADADLRDRLGAQARAEAARYTWLARANRALDGFPG